MNHLLKAGHIILLLLLILKLRRRGFFWRVQLVTFMVKWQWETICFEHHFQTFMQIMFMYAVPFAFHYLQPPATKGNWFQYGCARGILDNFVWRTLMTHEGTLWAGKRWRVIEGVSGCFYLLYTLCAVATNVDSESLPF